MLFKLSSMRFTYGGVRTHGGVLRYDSQHSYNLPNVVRVACLLFLIHWIHHLFRVHGLSTSTPEPVCYMGNLRPQFLWRDCYNYKKSEGFSTHETQALWS
jgi:hypothetical protein